MPNTEQNPSLYDLFAQLEKDVTPPDFIPPVKIPILGKFIEKKINQALVSTFSLFIII